MTSQEAEFLHEAREAVLLQASERLSDALAAFSAFCFKETPANSDAPALSEDFVSEMMKLFQEPRFLSMPDSYRVLEVFQTDWGRVPAEMKDALGQLWVSLFGQLSDDTAQLLITELIGAYLATPASLDYLDQLAGASNEIARAHVAHGLKCLAIESKVASLQKAAFGRLKKMLDDPSQIVKAEAASALEDLLKLGLAD